MLEPDQIITENEVFFKALGADLQAGIFASHRKDHVLMLFLHLREDQELTSGIQLLRSLGRNSENRQGLYLTSLQNQLNIRSNGDERDSLFVNVFLTANGLVKLGRTGTEWSEITGHLEANRDDLVQHSSEIWDAGYRDATTVDAVLLLGHQYEDALIRINRQLENELFPRAGIVKLFAEKGEVCRENGTSGGSRGVVVEHFGYADGASNPCVTERAYRKHLFGPKSMNRWNPVVPHSAFTVKEPLMGASPSFGSYLVYRKFEQHLDQFKSAVELLAGKLSITEAEAGALAFGRRKDGTPLEIDAAISDPENLNDFHYTALGKCPVFAHARKVNPREGPSPDSLPRAFAPPNPILRRGITYGKRKLIYGRLSDLDLPPHPVGLLFMSFQNSIVKYQEILKRCREGEVDPILSNLDQSDQVITHNLAGLAEPHQNFGGFVSLKGGLNLYAPSIRFFKEL